MLCPYCQVDVESFSPAAEGGFGLRCPQCDEDGVPVLYPKDYERHPAVPLSIFGPTGHGKTVYIEALLTHLERRIPWPGFACQWIDQAGMLEARQRLLLLRQQGQLPDATAAIFPRPLVVRLRNIPSVGGCQLLFYDTSGETFRDVDLLRDNGRYVKNSAAVLWLVSLAKGDLDYPEQLSDLMTTYAQAMVTMGGDPAKQAIVVALTKGDLLLDRPDLPQEARDFLLDDDLDPAGDAWDRLDRLSSALEKWLTQGEQRNVVNLLKGQFRSVRWCIVSAQGAAAQEQVLDVDLMPRGVLGPLFWLWRETRPVAWVETQDKRRPFFDLADAVAAAKSGATIRLEAGRYRLSAPLQVPRSLYLLGPGPGACHIESTAPEYAVAIGTNKGGVAVRGITFTHVGAAPAFVVRVVAGLVNMTDCVIRGGVAQLPKIQGDGIIVEGQGCLTLHNCLSEQNGGSGATGKDEARLVLNACKLRSNGSAGVTAACAEVDIQRSDLSENSGNGIHITEGVRAKVHRTTFRKNRRNGIAAFRTALAELHGNTCEENGLDGIVVKDDVVLAAVGNRCVKNRQAGISIHDRVKGEVSQNRCLENRKAGIELEDRAEPNVAENTCDLNQAAGIEYAGFATGRCESNVCIGNEGHGISAGGTAAPSLERNTCTNNGGAGIHAAGGAQPAVGQGNVMKDNAGGDYQPPKLGRRGWFG